MERVWCFLIGYAFGLFQTAVIYSRAKGIDIRTVGSGNAGTTNTLRVFGAKAGGIVLFGDMIKCILAVFITYLLFGRNNPEIMYLLKIYTAFGCVLGHDFPFYLKFKGGKGIAVTGGYIIAMHWTYVIVGLFAFFVPFVVTHFVSLGSLCLYFFFFVQLIIEGQTGIFNTGMSEMSQANLIELYVIAFIMTVLAFYQHRNNIHKLLTGTERKTFITKKSDL